MCRFSTFCPSQFERVAIFLSESVPFSVCLCFVTKSRAQRTLLVTKLSLFTCQGDCGGAPWGVQAEAQCRCAAGGSQPEARNGSSPSSLPGLRAGAGSTTQQGTGQWIWAAGKPEVCLCRAGWTCTRGFLRHLRLGAFF